MFIHSITLKNFLIIPDSQIELTRGLNAVTGETGSGKSLFVSAVKMIRGHRGVKNLVGKWKENCEIAAVIEIEKEDSELKEYLEFLSIDPDECDRIIIRRVFGVKNACYVNHVPVNKTVIEKLMSPYIEISSQFENQLLNKTGYQIQILDNSALKSGTFLEYTQAFCALSDIQKDIQALKDADDPVRRDYLDYQIREISQLKIREGEEIHLQQQVSLIENKHKIMALANEIRNNLESASGYLYKADTTAVQLKGLISFEQDASRISSANIEVDDLKRSICNIFSRFQECRNEESLIERYDLINSLLMKHNVKDSSTLLKKLEIMKNESAELSSVPDRLAVLEENHQKIRETAQKIADKIHQMRLAEAPRLESKIVDYLTKFGMTGVKFVISVTKNPDLDEHGCSAIRFRINTLGGTELNPISTLSGGELSRLLLSLKLINKDCGKFILFDEIDSNIGGETAVIAAAELKKSSVNNQILVVTHFPQTAGAADNHLVVEKFPEHSDISSSLRKVEGKQRLQELARMIGDSNSKEHIKAAEKLLKKNNPS